MIKILFFFSMALIIVACGKNKEGERCRGAEEMQMVCQVDWAEEYKVTTIPEWVKSQCLNLYPTPGCYFDSSKKHYWGQ